MKNIEQTMKEIADSVSESINKYIVGRKSDDEDVIKNMDKLVAEGKIVKYTIEGNKIYYQPAQSIDFIIVDIKV